MHISILSFKHCFRVTLFLFCTILLSACGGADPQQPTSRASDNQTPKLSLNGKNPYVHIIGKTFIDPGTTALDNTGTSIEVTITGHLDLHTPGSYNLSYNATDLSGNTASITRTVIVREPKPFITTWKTDNPGTSNANQIMITTSTTNQNYTINWGDGHKDTGVTGSITHTYDSTGVYTISISDNFHNLQFTYNDLNKNFGDAEKLLSIEQWGEAQWTTMNRAFAGCKNLELNAVDSPDLSLVKDMSGMFLEASSFNGDLSQWDVSTITDMSWMFYGASLFNGDISQWDVSSVSNMQEMFAQTQNFNGDISLWDVSSATDMSGMFFGASAFNNNISQWDVSSVSNMLGMFTNASLFNGDISQWDTSSVTNMVAMFNYTSAFNGDISQWDTSSVTDMSGMFLENQTFNGDISQWNTSSVTDMSWMFAESEAFNNDISQWDTSSVKDMRYMFKSNSAFNSNINQWNVSSVTNMAGVFSDAVSFNGDISKWNVSSVTHMGEMFSGARSFNNDISEWNVSSVTAMYKMFSGAVSFNRNISKWNVSSVKNMDEMFEGVTLSTENYDALLQGWSSRSLQDSVWFFGGNSQYSTTAESARNILINTYGWYIVDGGLLPSL